jgi:hypothetical protein
VLRAATVTVLGAGVVTGTGAGILRALNSDEGGGERLLLQVDATSGVGILEKPLKDLGLEKVGADLWQTPVLDTALVTMVGFTWRDGGRPPKILVRFRGKGGWSPWRTAPLLRDLPDPATGEGIGKAGTAPMVVEPTDGVQVQVSGVLPPELGITLIHAAPIASDARLLSETPSRSVSRAAAAAGGVAVPLVYTRAQWGANESWRDGPPRYNSTILQAHVHHSASGNGYAQGDVPALIRSFYRYHTKSLGWSDIAYNFLVDSFGNIWEGRYGGMDRPVRGAHTLGFNASSTGFCVIGNLDGVQPTQPTLDSLARLAAWKLSLYGRDPQGWTQVTSEGSDKFPKGRVVTLPVIDGHRDTNDTACPGGNLYVRLGEVRASAAGVITAATLKLKKPFSIEGSAVLGQALTVTDGKFKPRSATVVYQWYRNGIAIPEATAPTYALTVEDVGQTVGVVVTGNLPDVPPVSQAINLDRAVRSVPVCSTRTQRKKGGKVIIHFELTAPGVAQPDGTVVIKVGSRKRTVTVKNGKAVARFVGVTPGRYRVRCQYAGGTLVEPGKARDWVRVPGKGPHAKTS